MVTLHKTTKSKNWRVLDHTADLRIEVRGKTLAELFTHAAKALSSLLMGQTDIVPTEWRDLTLEAASLEDLLVEWLRELLFEHQVHGKVFIGAEVIDLTDTLLIAHVALGHSPESKPLQFEIKGVTYHDLRIVRRADNYVVRIIFDI